MAALFSLGRGEESPPRPPASQQLSATQGAVLRVTAWPAERPGFWSAVWATICSSSKPEATQKGHLTGMMSTACGHDLTPQREGTPTGSLGSVLSSATMLPPLAMKPRLPISHRHCRATCRYRTLRWVHLSLPDRAK